jgi:hypothetical protein
MFVPDPDFFHPGSLDPDPDTRCHKALDPDLQHWISEPTKQVCKIPVLLQLLKQVDGCGLLQYQYYSIAAC